MEEPLQSVPGEDLSRRKLTIAHFMPWDGIGGTETATMRMVELTRDRFRNVLFCLETAHTLQRACQTMGIQTVCYQPPEPSSRHLVRYYRDSRRVADQILRIGADILHFSDMKAAYHNSLAGILSGKRQISHFRVTYPRISARTRLTLRPLDCYIFVSSAVKDTFAVRLPQRKTRVIYDPVEPPVGLGATERASARSELAIPDNCTVVGMVARVSPQKDYFTLADAAALVMRTCPNTRFLVVGDNADVELNQAHYGQIVARLNELGIADKFIFTGHTSNVPRWIAAMDISVLSTHREGFGLSIVESMVMKKPTVATAVGGLLEVIDHGVTGYLHQPRNSRELADYVIALIGDPDKARAMGQAGYERVEQKFSRQAFVEQLTATYLSLVNEQT